MLKIAIMSRPLRIEYEDAWYHVMNRGTNRHEIFLEPKHYKGFLSLLAEITDIFDVEIHAYCLMNNHYHLLLRTPRANLSKIMKHLDGVYTQRFNKLTRRDGPLFRGRYKALLVEASSYLLRVSRYIHLNPVNKKEIKQAKDYKWSSCSAYLNDNKRPYWLHTDIVLGEFSNKETYHQYVSDGIDKQTAAIYQRKHYPSILGDDLFKKKCLASLKEEKSKESLPDIKRCHDLPAINDVINKISRYLSVSNEIIMKSKHYGPINIPRILSMLICRYFYGYKITEISNSVFGIRPNSMSSIVRKAIKRLNQDVEFQKLYHKITDSLKRDLTP